MAVDAIWTGATDGGLNTAGNWTGGVPLANEVALWPDGNSVSVTSQLADLTATDLDAIYVDPGYSGNIGSSGSPMDISSNLVHFRGSGEFWYKDGGGTTDVVIIDAASPTTVVNLAGDALTDVYLLRGTVTISGTITNLHVDQNSGENDVTCTIEGGATVTNIYQSAGNITSSQTSGHTIWTQCGGHGTLADTAGAIATLDTTNARMLYKSSTTMTTAKIGPRGVLDLTKLRNDLTITNLFRKPGSQVQQVGTLGELVIITNDYDMRVENRF